MAPTAVTQKAFEAKATRVRFLWQQDIDQDQRPAMAAYFRQEQ
jgi:hypothetical protein